MLSSGSRGDGERPGVGRGAHRRLRARGRHRPQRDRDRGQPGDTACGRPRVNRGVLVDDRMQTSDPLVFAAGDVAEHRSVRPASGRSPSSRPVSQRSTRSEATRSTRRSRRHDAEGDRRRPGLRRRDRGAGAGDEEIVVRSRRASTEARRARCIAIGGIVLGSEADAPALVAAVQEGRDVTNVLDRVRAGDWCALAGLAGATAARRSARTEPRPARAA